MYAPWVLFVCIEGKMGNYLLKKITIWIFIAPTRLSFLILRYEGIGIQAKFIVILKWIRTENFSSEFALIISAKAQPRLYNESYHVYWAVGFTQLHFEYPFCYPQLPPPQWHFHDAKIRNLINFRRLLTFKVFNLFRKYSRVKARGSKDYRQK